MMRRFWQDIPRAQWPRSLGALLLILCLALPLGTCSYYVDSSGQPVVIEDAARASEGVRRVTQWTFALEGFPSDGMAWLALFALAWPALATAVLVRKPRGRTALATRLLEVPLMAFSLALVDFISTFLVSRAIGAYVAFVGAGIYAIGALLDDLQALNAWRHRRHSPSDGATD